MYIYHIVCWQKSWSTRTIKQECCAALAGKLQISGAPGPCIISGIGNFDKLPDNLLNLPLVSPFAYTHTYMYVMCVCARAFAARKRHTVMRARYMGGRFGNVRVYWTGYECEKGPWRFLTCGEDLWTDRPFVHPYTRILAHKHVRSYFIHIHARTLTHVRTCKIRMSVEFFFFPHR
jgi:hypothetical protein